MTNKILLATFVEKNNIEDFYNRLDKFYSIKKDKTYIFSIEDTDNHMITFRLNSTENLKTQLKGKLRNTIQIHKKGYFMILHIFI